MCIIVVCEDKKPSHSFLKQCERENPHGGGIAWREIDKEGNTVVKFRKNIKADEIFKITKSVELPFVIHFRIASVGAVTPELAQPFPVGGDLRLKGWTKNGVVFHNGTWRDWDKVLYRTFPTPIPGGVWNDSRTMAYVTKLWGNDPNWLMLPAMSNRICYFSPDQLLTFGSWVKEQGYTLSHTMRHIVPAPPSMPSASVEYGKWTTTKLRRASCDGQPEPEVDEDLIHENIEKWMNDTK